MPTPQHFSLTALAERALIIIAFVLVLFVIVHDRPAALADMEKEDKEKAGPPIQPLSVFNHAGEEVAFKVEVPQNEAQMEQGLMFRKELSPYRGMLFDFGAPRRVTMWMKNTLIPLDMLFVDGQGTITQIAANTVPESTDIIASKNATRYVIELAGGIAKADGIAPGDHVRYPAYR